MRVGELACGRDYIGASHFPEWDAGFHQTELFFWCELVGERTGSGTSGAALPDVAQTGVRWVPVEELLGSPLFPRRLSEWLNEDPACRPIWLGDVN